MTTFVPEPRKALALAAANAALFLAAGSLFTSNLILASHHWLFPFHEGALLVQGILFARSGKFVRTLALLSVFVVVVGAARLETIFESGHLFHFSVTLLAGSVLHGLLAWSKRSPWKKTNSAASVFLLAGALATAWKAAAAGIDFGF